MTQMVQIGDDHEPLDMSKERNVEAFGRDFENWRRELREDRGRRVKFGSARVRSVPAVPYTGGLASKL